MPSNERGSAEDAEARGTYWFDKNDSLEMCGMWDLPGDSRIDQVEPVSPVKVLAIVDQDRQAA